MRYAWLGWVFNIFFVVFFFFFKFWIFNEIYHDAINYVHDERYKLLLDTHNARKLNQWRYADTRDFKMKKPI